MQHLVPPCDAGQEVEAVFGFCSIRNFTDATDVLKEKVHGSRGGAALGRE